MRAGVVVLLCLMMATPAFVEAAPKQATKAAKKAPKAKAKQAAPKQTPPATKSETVTRPNPLAESYAALPLAERVAIQTDLIIVGDYKGGVTGVFDDASIAAVKAFQKRKGNAETGVLNPKERGQLSADAKPKQAQRGWRVIDDLVAGVRIMVPSKMMPQVSQISAGSRFSSARGEMVVETFRASQAGTTLAAVFEQMKRQPAARRVGQSSMQGDTFEISGLQNLKLFHVYGYARGEDVRVLTILYDQALDGIMAPVVSAMSAAFVPFPTGALLPADTSKVGYASGITVSNDGHIVTDRAALEGCQVVTVAGIGGVDRVAEDKAAGLVLLRVYGAHGLKPVALAGETTKVPDVTLLGIADPRQQGGGKEVSTARARISETGTIEPAPAPGFTGAAVLDADGKLAGLVSLKAVEVAGPASGVPQATLTPVETIRNFLDAQNVPPAAGATPGPDPGKAALVRVICVRK